MNIPDNILCSKSHEFLQDNGDNTYTVGLTDYAIEQLGDIVFLELPEVGDEFSKGDTFATVEVTEINEALVDAPEMLNEDSYEKGWLVKIEATGDESEQNDLMEYEDYKEELE